MIRRCKISFTQYTKILLQRKFPDLGNFLINKVIMFKPLMNLRTQFYAATIYIQTPWKSTFVNATILLRNENRNLPRLLFTILPGWD